MPVFLWITRRLYDTDARHRCNVLSSRDRTIISSVMQDMTTEWLVAGKRFEKLKFKQMMNFYEFTLMCIFIVKFDKIKLFSRSFCYCLQMT